MPCLSEELYHPTLVKKSKVSGPNSIFYSCGGTKEHRPSSARNRKISFQAQGAIDQNSNHETLLQEHRLSPTGIQSENFAKYLLFGGLWGQQFEVQRASPATRRLSGDPKKPQPASPAQFDCDPAAFLRHDRVALHRSTLSRALTMCSCHRLPEIYSAGNILHWQNRGS